MIAKLVAGVLLILAVSAAPVQADTRVALWSAVHKATGSTVSTADLKPFTDAAGLDSQRPQGTKIRWWSYAKGTRSDNDQLPEQWYLHADGQRVHDSEYKSLLVMNPQSTGWRNHVVADCAERCFLDGVGTGARGRTTPALDPVWTDERWRRAVTKEVVYVAKHGGEVLPNSAFDPASARAFTEAAGRASTEGFRSLDNRDIVLAGKVWVFAKETSDGCGYLMASYLTANGPGDRFSCFARGTKPWVVPSSLDGARVGRALGPATRIEGGWRRTYAHAVVRVRHDGTWEVVDR